MNTTRENPDPALLELWEADAFFTAEEAWEESRRDQETRTIEEDENVKIYVPPRRDPNVRWVTAGRGEGASRVPEPPPIQDPRITSGPARGGRPPGHGKTIRWSGAPGTCGVVIVTGSLAGKRCPRVAGQGTDHLGAGQCVAHRGNKKYERAVGAWLMAHAFGEELNLTPWEALLQAVRIAAGKVAYCEWVLRSAKNDLELEGRVFRTGEGEEQLLFHPDTGEALGVGAFRDLSFWVRQSELWHDRMAKTAKMAIDAGVAKWQIEKAETDAQQIARVLNAVLEAVEGDIAPEQLAKMRSIMRSELLQMANEDRQAITAGVDTVDTSGI